MGQPASCEVRWGGSMPPQVSKLFEFWLVFGPKTSPGRMCGGWANLALIAPSCVRFAGRKDLLTQGGRVGPFGDNATRRCARF